MTSDSTRSASPSRCSPRSSSSATAIAFHRQVSLVAVGLVLVHPLIMFAVQPELLALPDPSDVPWGAVAAFVSVFALIALVVMALWRAKLKLRYETWHLGHVSATGCITIDLNQPAARRPRASPPPVLAALAI